MKDCMEAQGEREQEREGVGWRAERKTQKEGGREGERDRQTEREREGESKACERKGEGLRGPQASSNLWHGKKEELALSESLCAFTPQR